MSQTPSTDATFRAHYDAHRDAIWRYCRRRVPADEVHDAVADVFVVVWRRLHELPSDDEALLWMYGVARNVVRNRQRSGRRRRRLSARLAGVRAPAAASADASVARRDDQRNLVRALDRLDADDRELVRLRTWEELSLADIAAVTGLTVRAVETRLGRIRKRLAHDIGSDRELSPAMAPPARRDGDTPDPAATSNQVWLSPTRRQGGER